MDTTFRTAVDSAVVHENIQYCFRISAQTRRRDTVDDLLLQIHTVLSTNSYSYKGLQLYSWDIRSDTVLIVVLLQWCTCSNHQMDGESVVS